MTFHELHTDLLKCEHAACGQHNRLLLFCSACGRARTQLIVASAGDHRLDRYAAFRCRRCFSQRHRIPFCVYCQQGMKMVRNEDPGALVDIPEAEPTLTPPKPASTSRRPMREVYHDGAIRYVYTDVYPHQLVPLERSARPAPIPIPRYEPTPSIRKRVFQRDRGCLRCRKQRDLSVHHVVHRAHGGSNHLPNLQTLCLSCHAYVHNVLELPSGQPYSRDIEFGPPTQEDEDREWHLLRRARNAKHGKKPKGYQFGKNLATNLAAPEIARLRRKRTN